MSKPNDKNDNVLSLSKCPAEGCSKKAERMDFCTEHFMWFKEGLINKKGQKPRDFDKKYQDFLRRNKNAA